LTSSILKVELVKKTYLLKRTKNMILKREITQDIIAGSKEFPVIAILGPRQSGKTTLAQTIFSSHIYLTLEDPDIRIAAQEDPRTFLLTNRNEHGIIIDEFQHVPQLLSYIQTIVDQEKKAGTFILTGSQNFLMNQSISQSLAGRVSIHTLLPISIAEFQENNIEMPEIETILYQGCYPAIVAKKSSTERLYKNYMQTYLERDVRQLTHVGDLGLFQTFITLCAARIGQLVNFTSLGNDCGISDATVKRWLTILEASYIIFQLRPYHDKLGKRLIKSPKLYFYDTGLASFLLKIKDPIELATHPNRGNLFESFIISDIIKWFYNHGKLPSVYFWQNQTGHEVDCIIDQGLRKIPIEIKAGRTVKSNFFQGLEYWNQLTDNESHNGYVIYGGSSKQIRGYANLISWQSMQQLYDTI